MRVALKEFSGDGPKIRMRARVHGNGPGRDGKLCETFVGDDFALDSLDDRLGFVHLSVCHQPTGTFGDDAPDQDNTQAQHRAEPKAQPPAERFRNEDRIE